MFKNYNQIWYTQSKNSIDSMPFGGHSIGANVWVENNNIYLYVQQSGCFDENNSMLKFGRIRINFCPDIYAGEFTQAQNIENGNIQIKGSHGFVQLWADINSPIIHIEGTFDKRVDVNLSYESWRYETRTIDKNSPELFQCKEVWKCPTKEIKFYSDTIEHNDEQLYAIHQNNEDLSIDTLLKAQYMLDKKDEIYNPLKNRISGGLLLVPGFKKGTEGNGKYLETPYKSFKYIKKDTLSFDTHIILHTAQLKSIFDYKAQIDLIKTKALNNLEQNKEEDKEWWQAFFNKSYIIINPDKDEKDRMWRIGRNYNLFRAMLAFNYNGYWPSKFNGGLLTCDPECIGLVNLYGRTKADTLLPYTPDFRLWGGGAHTIQNQRLVYWPMLKSGDTQMMPQQFNLFNRGLKNALMHTEKYFGFRAATFPEQMNNYGLCNNEDYGWNNTSGLPDKNHIRYLFSNSLELILLIIRYKQYTGNEIGEYLPLINNILRFYNLFYNKNDDNGKMIIDPGCALESYALVKNPVDAIAGLKCVLNNLINLDDSSITDENKKEWKELLQRVPELSTHFEKGDEIISYAETENEITNCETPELYTIFPYDIFGIGHDNIELARRTTKHVFRTEAQKLHTSWHTTGIEYAHLGMLKQCLEYLYKKMDDGTHRYPAFWGPGHDWTPDHNWGSSGMIQLQDMLVKEAEGKLYLLPCWPKDEDVSFKLYISNNTTVEMVYKNKKIEKLEITPNREYKICVDACNIE